MSPAEACQIVRMPTRVRPVVTRPLFRAVDDNPFSTGPDCVWFQTSQGIRGLTRHDVNRLLDGYERVRRELLASGSEHDLACAKRVRSLWLDLDLARPAHWTEADYSDNVITLRASKTEWCAVPEFST